MRAHGVSDAARGAKVRSSRAHSRSSASWHAERVAHAAVAAEWTGFPRFFSDAVRAECGRRRGGGVGVFRTIGVCANSDAYGLG